MGTFYISTKNTDNSKKIKINIFFFPLFFLSPLYKIFLLSKPTPKSLQGFTKSGSNIYQSFGSTAVASYKSKNMCGAPNGRFVTGAPNDPYPLLSIVKGSNSINSAIKNKKVVRIMGHVSGLMCSRMRPRLNIRLNAGDSARSVIMPNTWTDETLGSSVFSIQPPCLERDGKDGKYKAKVHRVMQALFDFYYFSLHQTCFIGFFMYLPYSKTPKQVHFLTL